MSIKGDRAIWELETNGIDLLDLTISDFFDQQTALLQDKIALVYSYPEIGLDLRLTYRQFGAKVNEVARGLLVLQSFRQQNKYTILIARLNLKWQSGLFPNLFFLTKLFLKPEEFTFEISPLPLFTAPVFVPPSEIEKVAHFIERLAKLFGILGIFETFHGFVTRFNLAMVLFEPIVEVTIGTMFGLFTQHFFNCARVGHFLVSSELRGFLPNRFDCTFNKCCCTFEGANLR